MRSYTSIQKQLSHLSAEMRPQKLDVQVSQPVHTRLKYNLNQMATPTPNRHSVLSNTPTNQMKTRPAPIQMARTKKAKRKEAARKKSGEAYRDKLEQRILDKEIGKEARVLAEVSGVDPVAKKRGEIKDYLFNQLVTPQVKGKTRKAKNRKGKKAARAQAYREKMEQRVLDQQIGREAREQAQLSGHDLLEVENKAFTESLLSRPIFAEEARAKIDRYVAKKASSTPLALNKNRDTPARRHRQRKKKDKTLGLPQISRSLKQEYTEAAKRDNASYRISGTPYALSVEGQGGKYDKSFGEGAVFWRADTRPPKNVLKTGFTPKIERDLGRDSSNPQKGQRPNTIIYRTGTEDIVPASAVCVARDIRGACFFPFDAVEKPDENQEEHAYLYVLRLQHATNTFRAQQDSERAQTGKRNWRDPSRFRYDPSEAHDEEASAVWPYQEYAVHRIEPGQILGAWRFNRTRLVAPQVTGDNVKAGMRFRIEGKDLVRWSRDGKDVDPYSQQRQEAHFLVDQFRKTYPYRPGHYLSYQGIVRKVGKGSIESTRDAEQKVKQVDALPPQPKKLSAKKQARIKELARKKEAKQRRKLNVNEQPRVRKIGKKNRIKQKEEPI